MRPKFDSEGIMFGAIVIGIMASVIFIGLGGLSYVFHGLIVGAPLWLGIGALIYIGYKYEQRRARKGQ